jgi:hypothetical protein
MNAWFALLRDLYLMRRGPSDLPYSPIALLVLVTIATGFSLATHIQASPQPQPLPVLIGHLLDLVLLNALLALHAKPSRFIQTAAAELLASLPFVLLLFAALRVIGPITLPVTPENVRPEYGLLMPLLPLMLWWLFVRVRILSQALEIPATRAFSLLVLMYIAKIVLLTPFVKLPE